MRVSTTRRTRGVNGWSTRSQASAAGPDHVRNCRRAKAHRIGGAVAARIRGFQAGAHRQCRLQSAAARCKGLAASVSGWGLQLELLSHLERVWTEPDAGIWEMRGDPQHFTHSKLMAWVAFDRAIKTAEQFGLEGPLDRWREIAAAIHADVCARGYDRGLGSFVQSYGSKQLDASLLLMPLVGFLPPEDARVRGTLQAVERRLLVDGLLKRYDTAAAPDGLPAGEGAFLACSFWLVDAYVLQNRWQDARRLFARLLELRNDVGLLSEEYDPRTRRLVGNFPQAFTHVALINSAFNLTRLEELEEGTPRRVPEEASATA